MVKFITFVPRVLWATTVYLMAMVFVMALSCVKSIIWFVKSAVGEAIRAYKE